MSLARTTRAQREALFRVFQRDFPSWVSPGKRHERACCPQCGYGGATVKVSTVQYRTFRKTVHQGYDCLMLPWHGMWLGIEPDGYVHS